MARPARTRKLGKQMGIRTPPEPNSRCMQAKIQLVLMFEVDQPYDRTRPLRVWRQYPNVKTLVGRGARVTPVHG